MSEYWGEDHYPNDFYERLSRCFRMWGDDDLEAAQDAMWKGMIEYYQGKQTGDPWINCTETPNHGRCKSGWLEG